MNQDFKKIGNDELQHLLDMRCCGKYMLNNYYGVDLTDVESYVTENTLILKKDCGTFFRLYIISNDELDVIRVLKNIESETVINIPTRKGIDSWHNVLRESGYELLATYRRYCYSEYKKGNDRNLQYAEESDCSNIIHDLNVFFSPITGHLPKEQELLELIKNENIVVNRDLDTGVINGAMCYTIAGKKAEFPFWYDKGNNGLSLLYNVFYICHKKEVKNIQFWVNNENVDTIKLHKLLGAKDSGLVDYIYKK